MARFQPGRAACGGAWACAASGLARSHDRNPMKANRRSSSFAPPPGWTATAWPWRGTGTSSATAVRCY